MLRPSGFVLALCAALFASSARANEPAPAAPAANVDTTADAPRAPGVAYPHIYQAPLFGSLFAVAANEAVVDESALRYYASLHNVARANAEIRRLKALHPNWMPPTNIYAAAGAGNDEQPFWDLLAADRLEELRAGIALRMKSEVGWKPSRDLTVKIERKAAIEKLATLSDAEQWTAVLDIADSDPSILHCAYMDANWRVAEAFLKIGQPSRGFEIYHAIIAACPDHDDRLATIRKAITRFSVEQTKSLIAMGAKSSYGAQEFDGVKVELTRARIGAVNLGAKDEIEPEALVDFFAELARTHERGDLALAGWYEYGRGRYAEADRWFALGAPESPPAKDPDDIKFAEGHALSLLKSDRLDKALRVAWEWRDASVTMRRTYTDAMISLLTRPPSAPALSEAMLGEFVATLEKDRNFEAGQALGWYRQNRHEWDEAASWFKTALTWRGIDTKAPTDAGDLPDPAAFKAIEGLAMALSNAGRVDEALEIADAWRLTDGSLRALFIALATNAIDAADHAGAIAPERRLHFSEIAVADRSGAAARTLGWLDYRSGDFAPSIDWFAKAVAWSPNGRGDLKTNEGYALALKQAGRLAEAEEIAWTWRQQSPEMRATYISAVVAQLGKDDARGGIGAPRVERFASLVRTDHSALGAQALGWRRLREGNCAYASPWFRAAAAWSADRDNDAKNAEGLALSLRATGQFIAAEDLAYAWRERSPALRTLYIEIGVEELTRELPEAPMNEGRIARFASVVLADQVSLGAQALAWRRYRQGGCGYGANWFRLASLWVDEDKHDAKTDEGHALALRAIGDLVEAERHAKRWADKLPSMNKLYIDLAIEELTRDNPPEPIDENRLAEFAATIEPAKSAVGAGALGWYRLERGEAGEAVKWFKDAIDWWPPQRRDPSSRISAPVADYQPILAKLALVHDQYRRTPRAYRVSSATLAQSPEAYVDSAEGAAKTWEGYVQTLRALGRTEEAERKAYEWRDRWPALRGLFIEMAIAELAREDAPPLSPERLARYSGAIVEDHSISGASAMGWRFHARKDFASAADWFKSALDWSANAKPDSRLVEGYVLALRGERKFDESLAVAARWRDASPRFNALYLETSLLKIRDSGRTDELSVKKRQEIEAAMIAARSPEGALSVGWIAYEGQDYPGALTWFHNAIEWSSAGQADPKALEGYALALRAAGRYPELAAFARPWRDTLPEVRFAYYGGMMAWLTRAEPLADIEPETRDDFEAIVETDRSPEGAKSVGWGYALRKDWPKAQAWFERALDWSAIDPLAPASDAQLGASRSKLIEGYVQALRNNGKFALAEDIAFAWRGASELRGLYLQVFAQELAAYDAAEPFPADRLARFAKVTNDDRSYVGAQNMGWLSYRAKDWSGAVTWFERALSWSPGGNGDAKIREGYALSLRAAGRLAEAEEFGWTWRDSAPELRAAYVAAVSDQLFKPELAREVTPARLERFAGVVRAEKSAAGAQAMGWRRLQDGNCGYSVVWFRASLAWNKDRKDDDKANSGLAQGLRAAGMFNEAEDVAWAGRDRSKELRGLYINIAVEELTRPWPRVAMSEGRIARFGAMALTDRSSVAAQALGWRRYGEAGCGYGAQWFRLAAAWSADGKGDAKLNEGWALGLRTLGRLSKAEALAYPWIETQASMKKLYIDIVVEALSRDDPPQPMPEARIRLFEASITPIRSPLGAQALGWYRFARGEDVEAARWFKNALDWWPHPKDDADQTLSQPVDDYKAILAVLALRPEDYRRTPRAYPNSSLLVGRATESYVDTTVGLAKTVEGYVLSLRALGRLAEAEGLAFDWRDRWPRMRELFIDIAISELTAEGAPSLPSDRMDRLTGVIEAAHSARGAEALGWRAFAAKDFDAASRWFESALDWAKGDADAPRSANLIQAYALSLRGGKRYDEALRLLESWRDKSRDLGALYLEIGFDQFQTLDPASAAAATKLAGIAAGVSANKSAAGANSLGWLAYQRKEFPPAQAWFRQAIVWTLPGGLPDPKALEGYARCLQAQNRFGDLLKFTGEWAERVPALKPLYLEAASQALSAAAAGGEEIATDILVRAAAAFAGAHSATGAQALAWQRIAAKDWVAAAAWFQAARSWSGAETADPKIDEGLIIALRNLHRDDDAEALAFAGAGRDENLRELYIEIVADRLTRKPPSPPNEQGMRRFADFVASAKSANGAQALGWYSYNARQGPAATAWFEKSIAWDVSEDAALGLALAYRQSGDRAAYSRVISTYGAQFSKVADLGAGRTSRLEERRAALEIGEAPRASTRARSPGRALPETDGNAHSGGGASIWSALNAKDYATCVARGDEAARSGELGGALQSAVGWCLLNLGRPQESAQAFDAALGTTTGKAHEDAAYGKSLSLLASGEAAPAGKAAAEGGLTPDRRNAIGIRVLEQRVWDAYGAHRWAEAIQWLDRSAAYTPETRDLMEVRARCLEKLGQPEKAQAISEKLDAQILQ